MIKNRKILTSISLIFVALLGWWIAINIRSGVSEREIKSFSDSIWFLSFTGGLYGLFAAKKWGGFKSVFGKAVSYFSLGLLAQGMGQIAYIIYDYVLNNENPYPSVADFFFFATIPLYVLGLFYLAKALIIRFQKVGLIGRFVSLLFPVGVLGVTYVTFLKGYEKCFEDPDTLEKVCSTNLATFLDFAYPIGGAIYISVAALIFVLSFKALGGMMRGKITILLLGLLLQFSAEVNYLYLTYHDELELGKTNDLLYMAAYFVIAVSIINIGSVADTLSTAAAGKLDNQLSSEEETE